MASRLMWQRGGCAAGVLAVCACAMGQEAVAAEPEAPAAAAPAPAEPDQQSVPESMASEAKEQMTTFRLPAPEWTVRIEPRAWWVSPSGEIKLPAASGSGPAGFTDSGQLVEVSRLNLDTPRLSAAGEVEVSAERWRFAFSAGGFSLDRDSTIADAAFRLGSVEVSPGEALSVRMEYLTFELTAGYEVWSRDFRKASQRPEDAIEAGMRLIVLAGARIHDLDVGVASLDDGTSAATDQTYFEPLGGVRMEAELWEQFTITFQASGGAWVESDRSVFSFDMSVAFGWEPTRQIGVEIGWRQMLMIMKNGEEDTAEEFEFTGGMAGLFAGVVVRF